MSTHPLPVIAVTSGEPAGVGPELCARLAEAHAERAWPVRLVILGDERLLHGRVAPNQAIFAPYGEALGGEVVELLGYPLARAAVPGRLDPGNSRYVLSLLQRALSGCLSGEFAAVVTAPVHKGIINDAGVPFTGHTEFFAEGSHTARVVMMLVGGGLRVALATTHLPLADVPRAITRESLGATLDILAHDLNEKWGIARPCIAVCGLNPHAGEGGHLGREEIEVIEPVLAAQRALGRDLVGPVPADTLFVPAHLQGIDAVLAMYHDQGLPVLKRASFGHGVNVTLGLPFVRTSVDHGTALDLAGSGQADPGSLFAAVELAIDMLARKSARR
ncbi:4-hydroxythreonine-4-phosphate dehydrogenase [Burkholderiales bacterium]|nr:MAG: 4-hydroxythreonine-4-phosphate dehydrogenase PdxA [Burkholderiales bacterium]CAG0969753.1 4-hydroxythreonine-4-phosphate dehydrogenase [Burkholderiales bacterium]